MYTPEEKKVLEAKIADYQRRSQEATKAGLVLEGAAQGLIALLEEDAKLAASAPPPAPQEAK